MLIPPSLICVLLWSMAFAYFVRTDAGVAVSIMMLAWAMARILFHRSAK